MGELNHSEQLNELFSALAKAQAKMLSAKKDSNNPFFKSKYSDLNSVWEACREPLTTNNLCIIQTVEGTKDSMFIVTWLGHSSGQWMKSKLPIMPTKPDHQSVGSAISYGKRYALSAMVGVVSGDDDDGEAAMRNARQGQIKPIVAHVLERKVTEQEADELSDLLKQDPDFKDSVESFILQSLGKNAIVDISYRDFEKILKRTKQHLEKINETR